VVQVIDNLEEGGVIRFNVRRSSRDHNLILGSWQHAVDEPGGMGSIGQSLGESVEIEYQRVREWAARYGVPLVWVDDPNGLFPPAQRQTREPTACAGG
jgi:hypothetical protein